MGARKAHNLEADGSSPSSAIVHARCHDHPFAQEPSDMGGFCVTKEVGLMLIKTCTKCGKIFQFNGHSLCPGCAAEAEEDRKQYKAQHKEKRDKDRDREYNRHIRDKETDRFYHSAKWKRLSKVVLMRAHYLCAECGGLASEVHHIIEVRDAPDKRLDITNLIPLCTSCHNKKRRGAGKKVQTPAGTSHSPSFS